MKRILSRGPDFQTDFHGDGKGGATFHTHGDAGALLDRNARRYDGDRMARRKSDMREIAEIDTVTFTRWLREENLTMQQVGDPVIMNRFLKKKLNDPDNAKFRTGPERL